MVKNVTIVIRTAGERTIDACYKILAKQVPESSIFVLAESPFSKAVVKTFEIGIREQKQWTIAIDADWLLTETAIEEMVKIVSSFPEDLYIYQGMILDYLYNEYRFNGPHLYNTKHLPQALKEMSANPNELRPESFTYRKMAKHGFFTYCDTRCYAIHDFEQYAKDYYRKGFFHGKKAFPDQLGAMLHTIRDRIVVDSNYEIALMGLLDGVADTASVQVDIDYFEKKYDAFLERENRTGTIIKEESFVMEPNYVAKTIAEHQRSFPKIQPNSWRPYSLSKTGKTMHGINELPNSKKKSIISRGFNFIGKKCIGISKKIK